MPEFTPEPDSLDAARRRARYRAWHRGTKELDLILGRYADARINSFDALKLALFEAVMENEENQLQQWFMGQTSIPATQEGEMLEQIRAFHLSVKDEADLSR